MPALATLAQFALYALTHPSEAKHIITYKVRSPLTPSGAFSKRLTGLARRQLWRDPLNKIDENPESGWDRPDMKKCWGYLDATSRSFSAVIHELDGDLSRVIAIFYLILRGLDTIEDDMTIPIEKKTPLLENFYKHLEEDGWNFQECASSFRCYVPGRARADLLGLSLAAGPNEKDRALLQEFQVVVAEFKRLEPGYKTAISDITKKMGDGMSRYAKVHAASGGRFSVDTLASFDLYCHFVAGLVGEGLSRLFSASGKESPYLGEQLTLSNSMGLMLQKTNILRDFREDTDEGRVFWPAEIWSKYADKPEDLYKKGNEEKALWALSEMTVDALAHATDALDYLTLLGNQSVFNFCAIPQVMAMATLEACFMNLKVMHRNVKIRKGEAVGLILAATNPRDVAYIFRDYMRKIHAKARANDPSFIKIAVLAGRVRPVSSPFFHLASPSLPSDLYSQRLPSGSASRTHADQLTVTTLWQIEQWTESRYPSFIKVGEPVPMSRNDWTPGRDARIKQLPGPDTEEVARRERREAAAAMGQQKMTKEDYKFLCALIGGIFGVVAVILGISGGAVWFFYLREGAWYGNEPTATRVVRGAAAATKSVVQAIKEEL
ncbi:SPOSA6832_00382, partial [Sporobolomyces salmonicolor]